MKGVGFAVNEDAMVRFHPSEPFRRLMSYSRQGVKHFTLSKSSLTDIIFLLHTNLQWAGILFTILKVRSSTAFISIQDWLNTLNQMAIHFASS